MRDLAADATVPYVKCTRLIVLAASLPLRCHCHQMDWTGIKDNYDIGCGIWGSVASS